MSKDSGSGGRFLPATAARTDQPEASVGRFGRPDQLGTSGRIDERELRVAQGSPSELAAPEYGSLYLQHAFDLSDEEVVWQRAENPHRQFAGETYLHTEPPIDPSSLTRWRKRLGEAGVEELLAETIEAAKRAGVIKAASVKRVIVDTRVIEKAGL